MNPLDLEAGAAGSRMVSESGVGAHFDEETSLEALASQYSQAEGGGNEPRKEHWDRAREELARRWLQGSPSNDSKVPSKPSADDIRVEEAMHLGR
ncbi:hypothetical protein [Roseimicrobium sp. ORNL1]|uniref:hypothetical protein n=1 Tax=Roseimicrobium sp. ORNL1 TaxID=2711231 RepID=UPI0013E11AB4|nr:hypothetical protein [Roseimicrobium sp. ORNL1]QIF03066.1 hypothetical protein G5S37_16570 [Roseimicrobium sp. ORNL1]